jgi:hypothetical protein
MRRIGVAFVSAGLLAGCASGTHPVSQDAAVKSALTAVEALEREHARSVSTLPVTGFTVVSAHKTGETASVSDSRGHVLTVTPAPREAWIVEITAPPQGIWGSISALAEVDSTSGVVSGVGLWAIPADQPLKGA